MMDTIQMLRPEEVEILVCGSPKLDLRELQKNTEYDGFKATDHNITYSIASNHFASSLKSQSF